MRVAIYGAGAMGTILGAYIAASGKQIDLITRNKEHVEAMKQHGARVLGHADFTVRVNAYILLAVPRTRHRHTQPHSKLPSTFYLLPSLLFLPIL